MDISLATRNIREYRHEYWSHTRTFARAQFRKRRSGFSVRCAMLHTTQAAPDYVAEDNNAEKTAEWILKRTSPGSYHDITDRDSFVPFINPLFYASFGCRSVDDIPYNDITVHQSMSTRAEEYRDDEGWLPEGTDPHSWTINGKAQYALNGAIISARNSILFAIPRRIVTPGEIKRGHSGFITHGMADPLRRFDPGFSEHELGIYIDLVEEIVNPPLEKAVTVIGDPLRGKDKDGQWPFWAIYPNGRIVSHNGARPAPDLLSGVQLNAPVEGAELMADRLHLRLYAPGDGGTFEFPLPR